MYKTLESVFRRNPAQQQKTKEGVQQFLRQWGRERHQHTRPSTVQFELVFDCVKTLFVKSRAGQKHSWLFSLSAD